MMRRHSKCLEIISLIDEKSKGMENEIEVSNQNIKQLMKKYEKKKEIPFEHKLLIKENNYSREVFIYHKDSKKEKRAYISALDKNNIYEQSEYIGKSNPEGIYKFRNIVFEKYGKGFLNDHYILKRGISKK